MAPSESPVKLKSQPVLAPNNTPKRPINVVGEAEAKNKTPNGVNVKGKNGAEKETPKPRPRACTKCRQLKAKCYGGDDDKPCDRCVKNDRVCVFEDQKRGRKHGTKLMDVSGTEISDLDDGERRRPRKRRVLLPAQPQNDTSVPPPEATTPTKKRRRKKADGTHAAEVETPEPVVTTAKSANRERRSSVRETRQTTGSLGNGKTIQLTGTNADDPVMLGILDEDIARELYAGFTQHLNIFVHMLDPILHTFELIRSRSSFLLTVILSCAAKYMQPTLYSPLQIHAENQLGEMMLTGDKSTEIVQAILIMRFWRELIDERASLLVGLAIRKAIEMRWDILADETWEGMTELSIREQRTKQRTWMVLVVYDKILSYLTGKVHMIQPADSIQTRSGWDEGKYGWSSGDAFALGLLELRSIGKDLKRDFNDDQISEKMFETLMEDVNEELDDWDAYWCPRLRRLGTAPKSPIAFITFMYKNHYTVTLNALALQKSLASSKQRKDGAAMATCYKHSMMLLQGVIDYGKETDNELQYITDPMHMLIAFCEIALIKILLLTSFRSTYRFSHHDTSIPHVLNTLLNLAKTFESACPPDTTTGTLPPIHARFSRHMTEQYRQILIGGGKYVMSSADLLKWTPHSPSTSNGESGNSHRRRRSNSSGSANGYVNGVSDVPGKPEFRVDKHVLDTFMAKSGSNPKMDLFV